jgi:cytochrome P450
MTDHLVSGRTAYDVLHDPAYVPPPATTGPPGSLGWLRSSVPRFSAGAVHERRRRLVTAALEGLEPERLRQRARELTHTLRTDDVVREVPVRTLAEALGLPDVDVSAVRTVASGYLSGVAGPETDAAVATLVESFGGVADEQTAARISLLVQACEATAALIGKAMPAVGDDVGALVESVLQTDPPVRSTTRQDAAGETVRVDLAELPFGAGPHACPGRQQAVALATGVCEAMRTGR